MRAHSSFLNIEHEEQSKQRWKSQDLLRLDSRLCRCQMPSDEEVLAPGPSQKGRNWSIWRSYCVLGTAQCWMYLYLFVAWDLCGEYIVLLGGLGHWGSETQRRSDLLGQGLKAGMWLSRKGTQCQPVCFLVYLTVTFSLAWQAGGLPAPPLPPARPTASLTAIRAGGLWNHPSLGQQPLLRIMIQSGSSQHFWERFSSICNGH